MKFKWKKRGGRHFDEDTPDQADSAPTTFDSTDDAGPLDTEWSRTSQIEQEKQLSTEEKTLRLKRKLNKAIIILIVLIILVFLFMRFINF